MPRIIFHYDALSAAGVAFGWFGSDDPLSLKAQALRQLIRYGHPVDIEARFTRGHDGDPGQEGADVLAKQAAVNVFQTDRFWIAVCDEAVIKSVWMQWFWMLTRAAPFGRQDVCVCHIPRWRRMHRW